MKADPLFGSWLRVNILWWVFVLVYWGSFNSQILSSIEQLNLFYADFLVPCSSEEWLCPTGYEKITVLNALASMLSIVVFWTIPLLTVSFVTGSLGAFSSYLIGRSGDHKREDRLQGKHLNRQWRNVGITYGELERPLWDQTGVDPVTVSSFGKHEDKFASLSGVHVNLFREVLGYAKAHPDSFIGSGHDTTLLEHTLNVVNEALDNVAEGETVDPLLPIAAAAHDIGKTVAWKKDEEGQWRREFGVWGLHDTQSGLLLSGMPSFQELDDDERRILLVVVKYSHKRWKQPRLEENLENRVLAICDALGESDTQATAKEQASVKERLSDPETFDELIGGAFLEAITEGFFNTPNLARGKRAIGWRVGDRLFLIELGLKDAVADHLPHDVAASLGAFSRPQNGVCKLTLSVIEFLEKKGWIVRTLDRYTKEGEYIGQITAPEGHAPIFNLIAGKSTFNGVIAVDLPEEEHRRLPQKTTYELYCTGLMFGPSKKSKDNEAEKKIIEKKKAERKHKRQIMDRLTDEEKKGIDKEFVKLTGLGVNVDKLSMAEELVRKKEESGEMDASNEDNKSDETESNTALDDKSADTPGVDPSRPLYEQLSQADAKKVRNTRSEAVKSPDDYSEAVQSCRGFEDLAIVLFAETYGYPAPEPEPEPEPEPSEESAHAPEESASEPEAFGDNVDAVNQGSEGAESGRPPEQMDEQDIVERLDGLDGDQEIFPQLTSKQKKVVRQYYMDILNEEASVPSALKSSEGPEHLAHLLFVDGVLASNTEHDSAGDPPSEDKQGGEENTAPEKTESERRHERYMQELTNHERAEVKRRVAARSIAEKRRVAKEEIIDEALSEKAETGELSLTPDQASESDLKGDGEKRPAPEPERQPGQNELEVFGPKMREQVLKEFYNRADQHGCETIEAFIEHLRVTGDIKRVRAESKDKKQSKPKGSKNTDRFDRVQGHENNVSTARKRKKTKASRGNKSGEDQSQGSPEKDEADPSPTE